MQESSSKFQKYLFVCEHERAEGGCCSSQGVRIREFLKEKVKNLGLSDKIRVSRSGCLDVCVDGPNVLMSPDNIWFKHVAEKDIDEIIRVAMKGII